ncbi:DNA-binding protein [Kribbella sp. ALI-6-A]|uniref:helix-turn-helix domain-containing protein n=1 Tax=Kribbella sp. ALI-6-A TaxID=1933817 RepID=UPI00097BBDF9|nr:helix-turn-helix domain-containing protein [Kribbella sp. ALI-6-A]ONI68480.1 DNA-binding protein [Kribbella sp. ALI-6-A]
MRPAEPASVQPDAAAIATTRIAARRVHRYLTDHGERSIRIFVGEDPGETFAIPRSAVELLARALDYIAAGQGVKVVPAPAELTTRQAADLLNVSQPYLVGLLDAGEIEHRDVGRHRLVRTDALMAFKRSDDLKRRGIADELTVLDHEVG